MNSPVAPSYTALLYGELDIAMIELSYPVDLVRCDNFKKLKSAFRSHNVVIVLMAINTMQQEVDVKDHLIWIRKQLKSSVHITLVVGEQAINEDDFWSEHVDDIISSVTAYKTRISSKLNRIIQRQIQQDSDLQKKTRQTDLLIAVNQFAQLREPTMELTRKFAVKLANYCGSSNAFIIKSNTQLNITNCIDNSKLKADSPLFSIVEKLNIKASQTTPDVCMIVDEGLEQQISSLFDEHTGSYLLFPIVVYGQQALAIVCFISEQQMQSISIQQVDVMKEAALQLTILLERRVAETKLKAQYQRLKTTLHQLNLTKEQLVHSEKMAAVGKLAAGIAHEINNPLSFVLSNLDPLDEYMDTLIKLLGLHDDLLKNLNTSFDEKSLSIKSLIENEQQDADVEFMVSDIKAIMGDSKEGLIRVKEIISDLSQLSRQQDSESEQVNISLLLEESLKLFKYEIDKSITLTVDCDQDLTAHSNKGYMQRILTNLVNNAIQSLNNTTLDNKHIALSCHTEGDSLLISVTDNGPGIQPKDLKSVFEPFFTTKPVGAGTGLGLSVCYGLAKKLNGNLTAASKPNQETRFTLTLPFKTAPAD
jgi:two-component system NtrC family sensor kinase